MSTLNPPKRLLTRLFKPGVRCTPANILNPDNWTPIYYEPTPLGRDDYMAAKLRAAKLAPVDMGMEAGKKRWLAEPAGIRDEVLNEDKDVDALREEYVVFDVEKFRKARFIGDGEDAEEEEEVVAAKAIFAETNTKVTETNEVAEDNNHHIDVAAANVSVSEDKNDKISQVDAAPSTNTDTNTNTEVEEENIAIPEEEIYEVEAIVGHILKKGVLQYQIKWVGYDLLDCTFEPEENLDGAKEILEEYKKKEKIEA